MNKEMDERIKSYYDQALKALSNDERVLKRLYNARKIYEELTGKVDDDKEEYELRMLNFNEWFLFDFVSQDQQWPFIIEFLNSLNESIGEIKDLFSNVRYSFFECRKKKLGSKLVLEDFLLNKKYQINAIDFPVNLLDDEIFTGRIISIEQEIFILKGIRWLPRKIRALAVKEAKKVRKMGNPSQERDFTLNLEMATTKCSQFKHVDPIEIFSSVIL